MRWRELLIISSTLFLLACQEEHSSAKDSASMVVLPVEYYSGAPISNVVVELYDEAGNQIGKEISNDGEAIFTNLQSAEIYSVRIGSSELKDLSVEKSVVLNTSNPYAEIKSLEEGVCSIYSCHGWHMYEYKFTPPFTEIQLPNLPGVYIVIFKTVQNNRRHIQRIIIY